MSKKIYGYVIFDWFSGRKKEFGIVNTWDECKEKTYKVNGNRLKSFKTIEEATEWLEDPVIKGKEEKYYAVHSSLVQENPIFQDYPRLKALIDYHKENGLEIKFKGFQNEEDAKKWLNKLT